MTFELLSLADTDNQHLPVLSEQEAKTHINEQFQKAKQLRLVLDQHREEHKAEILRRSPRRNPDSVNFKQNAWLNRNHGRASEDYKNFLLEIAEGQANCVLLSAVRELKREHEQRIIQLENQVGNVQQQVRAITAEREQLDADAETYAEMLVDGLFDEAEAYEEKRIESLDGLSKKQASLEQKFPTFDKIKSKILYDVAVLSDMQQSMTKAIRNSILLTEYRQQQALFNDLYEQMEPVFLQCSALATDLKLDRHQFNLLSALANSKPALDSSLLDTALNDGTEPNPVLAYSVNGQQSIFNNHQQSDEISQALPDQLIS